MKNLIFLFALAALTITGCKNTDFMQSESAINAKIAGTWKRIGSSQAGPDEKWKFENGKLTITSKTEITVTETGNYTVLTKISKCYVTLSGFTDERLESSNLNRRWNIAELKGNVLYLSSTDDGGSIISREFVKE